MSRNAAVALLADLRRRYVHISVRGDRIRVRAPKGAVSDRDRDALGNFKPALIERLKIEARLLGLSLDEFARQDLSIELAVPWLDGTIWFVPGVEQIDALVRDGTHRGRIWTVSELKNLLSAPGLTGQDVISLARLKAAFGGDVVSVGADESGPRRSGAQG